MRVVGLGYLSRGFVGGWKRGVFQFLLVLYSVLTLCGYVFVAAALLPEEWSWVASLILVLGAAVVLLSESRADSVARRTLLFAVIVCLALGLEYVGMRLGVPFGAYAYTDRLGVRLLDVPVAIPAAWYTTVITTWRIARGRGRSPLNVAISAGVLTLALDLVLEPMASFVNGYWIWSGDRVPIQNYLSWFVVGSVAAYALERMEPSLRGLPGLYGVSMLVFLLQAGLFVVADLVAGFLVNVVLATGAVAGYFLMTSRFWVRYPESMR